MQGEFSRHFPSLEIQLLGINDEAFPSGNDNITEGRNLPWVQDVDTDGDNQSDAWVEWDIVYRDVAIVDRNNELVTTFNLTTFDLGSGTNYDDLKQLLISTATTEPESEWQSPVEPLDVNGDGLIAPLDALLVINDLDEYPGGQLPDSVANQAPYIDTTGDGLVGPLDALRVINQLTFSSNLDGAGEPQSALSADASSLQPLGNEAAQVATFQLDQTSSNAQSSADRYSAIDEIFAVTDDDENER